ncbi:endonuclease/exonuclease/phosphatase family protein [Flavobacterium sp. RNTU_13]|uniref:endonuclease/exonuclease/phosphatase family protein n=1 Tax=Flavobacterium sp. RNTU_13 TaxID=3375145 RepID=UPI003985BB67
MKQLFIALGLIAAHTVSAQTVVRAMTYNLRLDVSSDGENKWDNRKNLLAKQIEFYEPDFLGVQEALPQQMHYLDSTMTAYDFIGVGRDDGKEKGEFSAIFYNKSKFKVLQQSTFWLSQHPDKPGLGWDAACNRVCTYGLFENLKTKKKFWIFNTHFDHIGTVARMESAKLILAKIKELNNANYPFVLTGDFNLKEDNESIKKITETLYDAKKVAKLNHGPEGTWNAFDFSKPVTERIDYIFIPKDKNVSVKKYATLSDNKNLRYFSDHLAVLADIEIK